MFDFLAAGGGGGVVAYLIILAIAILEIAGLWKVFSKAGQPGWAAIIPIYNTFVLLRVVGRPLWWFILFLIPFVNVVIYIIVMLDLAKAFGKSAAFGIGLFLLSFIFVPILGFGDAQYQGAPAAAGATV